MVNQAVSTTSFETVVAFYGDTLRKNETCRISCYNVVTFKVFIFSLGIDILLFQ